jgi:hypothetical protein
MKTINYCIVVPENVNIYAEENTTEWYELYTVITNILKDKVYNTGIEKDICSTNLFKDGTNLIFQYKAVPVEAPTMASFSHYHALIVRDYKIIK